MSSTFENYLTQIKFNLHPSKLFLIFLLSIYLLAGFAILLCSFAWYVKLLMIVGLLGDLIVRQLKSNLSTILIQNHKITLQYNNLEYLIGEISVIKKFNYYLFGILFKIKGKSKIIYLFKDQLDERNYHQLSLLAKQLVIKN